MSHTSRAKYAPRPVTFLAREVRAEIVETEIERDALCFGALDCANYGARRIADRAARWGVAPRAVGVDAERAIERTRAQDRTAERILIGAEIRLALTRYGEGWLDYDTFITCRAGGADAGALRSETGHWVAFDESGQWKFWREIGEGDDWFTRDNVNMRIVMEEVGAEIQLRSDEQFYFEMEMDN